MIPGYCRVSIHNCMRRLMKFLHTASAIGLAGGLSAYMLALSAAPDISSVAEYSALRNSLATVSTWLILPSMVVVLASGLLSIAVHRPFHNAIWAWIKAASGILIFEETLRAIDAPAQAAARAAARTMSGEIDIVALPGLIHDEWVSWWLILALSAANIALGIWRPRIVKQRRPATEAQVVESK